MGERKCQHCGGVATQDRPNSRKGDRSYYMCKSCNARRQRDYLRRLRDRAISEYGGKCACCGEGQPEFLAFDHVNNDGAQHRKRTEYKHMVVWLRANNFPKDTIQLLCHNCNAAKGFYGMCPHQQKVAITAQI